MPHRPVYNKGVDTPGTIIQSGAGGCEVCAPRAFPWSGVLARSRVLAFSAVLALSVIGVWTCSDLAERSVLFLWIGGDRARSETGVLSRSGTPIGSCCFNAPAAWLGMRWLVRLGWAPPRISLRKVCMWVIWTRLDPSFASGFRAEVGAYVSPSASPSLTSNIWPWFAWFVWPRRVRPFPWACRKGGPCWQSPRGF